jgi:hypothetical protein
MHLERKTAKYKVQADKGRKDVQFEEGDLVWVHLRKERFPSRRKSKLDPRGDGPFRVVKRIGPNAYRLDLPGDYAVHPTFNVADLTLYEPDDDSDDESRTLRGQVEENDAVHAPMTPQEIEDLAHIPFDGPITRDRAKKLKKATRVLLARIPAMVDEPKEPRWITLIHHVQA